MLILTAPKYYPIGKPDYLYGHSSTYNNLLVRTAIENCLNKTPILGFKSKSRYKVVCLRTCINIQRLLANKHCLSHKQRLLIQTDTTYLYRFGKNLSNIDRLLQDHPTSGKWTMFIIFFLYSPCSSVPLLSKGLPFRLPFVSDFGKMLPVRLASI